MCRAHSGPRPWRGRPAGLGWPPAGACADQPPTPPQGHATHATHRYTHLIPFSRLSPSGASLSSSTGNLFTPSHDGFVDCLNATQRPGHVKMDAWCAAAPLTARPPSARRRCSQPGGALVFKLATAARNDALLRTLSDNHRASPHTQAHSRSLSCRPARQPPALTGTRALRTRCATTWST